MFPGTEHLSGFYLIKCDGIDEIRGIRMNGLA
jgi:hypothetical protein